MQKVDSRPLNMDEKRKLEKIIFTDIDKAIHDYRNKRYEIKTKITDKLVKSPKVLKLVKGYEVARLAMEKAEREAEKMNIRMNWGNRNTANAEYRDYNNGEDTPKEVISHNDRTAEVEKKLENMKRDYTLKLFAGGIEAQEVFESLARELEKITA